MDVPKGRVAYEPNTLAPAGRGRARAPVPVPSGHRPGQGPRASETFADHYSQARLFWRSMTEPEQGHIVAAFTFELCKVETSPSGGGCSATWLVDPASASRCRPAWA